MPSSPPPSRTQAHPHCALVSRLIVSLFYLLRCFFKTNRNLQASGMIYCLIRDLGGRMLKNVEGSFHLANSGCWKMEGQPAVKRC